jgi:hypothetical protein
MEELTADVYRRRPSYAPSWAEDDDEMSHRSNRRRNSSWGPVGEIAYVNSLYLVPPRSPTSHHQCNYDILESMLWKAIFCTYKDATIEGVQILIFEQKHEL